MILLAIIAASVAAFAVVGMWLYTRPDIRVWLAAYLAPLWSAARKHRGRLVVAASGLATVLVLVNDGFAAAIPIVLVTFLVWLCRRVMREADEDELKAERRAQWLTDGTARVTATRDAYADALNHVLRLADLDAVKAVASTALETGSYPGDLASARAGHEACELELRDTKADLADARSWLPGEGRSS